MDIVGGGGGGLVLRASSSSVESPGFMAAYSAHVIRPPSAGRHHDDEGEDEEDTGPSDDADTDAASVDRWAGTASADAAAEAIRSLEASAAPDPVRTQGTC